MLGYILHLNGVFPQLYKKKALNIWDKNIKDENGIPENIKIIVLSIPLVENNISYRPITLTCSGQAHDTLSNEDDMFGFVVINSPYSQVTTWQSNWPIQLLTEDYSVKKIIACIIINTFSPLIIYHNKYLKDKKCKH